MKKERNLILESKICKDYHNEQLKLTAQKYGMLALTLLPVIFYKRLPIFKHNTDFGSRIVLSSAIVVFPNLMYQKHLEKSQKNLNSKFYNKYGQKIRKFELSGDISHLNDDTTK